MKGGRDCSAKQNKIMKSYSGKFLCFFRLCIQEREKKEKRKCQRGHKKEEPEFYTKRREREKNEISQETTKYEGSMNYGIYKIMGFL